MERYVLLVKAPRDHDISPVREELREFLGGERHPELKVEMHRCIGLTVDLVILHGDGVVLVKRKNEPFKGSFALPGGFVEYGERVEEAAVREAKEETGLDVRLIRLVGGFTPTRTATRGGDTR